MSDVVFNSTLVASVNAQLAAIVDSSDDAIISKNLDGIVQSWNIAAEKIFGYSASEMIGASILRLIPDDLADQEKHILAQIKAGNKIDHFETRRKRKDGSDVQISLTVSPIKDPSGKVIGASKIARDISKRKAAEEIELHYSAIVASSDDAILSKDLNGIIKSWNRGAEKIFGYSPEEVVGKSVTILIPQGHENEEPTILGRIRRGESIEHYETVRQKKDGSIVNISLTVSPIKNESGEVIGASKIARDITALKKAEQATKESQKALALLNEELERRVQQRTASLNLAIAQMEEFSYSISHDLRSPVRSMQAYANALLEDHAGSLNDEGKDFLNRIVRSSQRMDKLILDVLVYTRIAKAQIVLAPIDLNQLVQDIIIQYEDFRAPKAKITIQGTLGNVLGQDSLLTQVLSNLMSNAVKFVSPGKKPQISIWTERIGNVERLSIKDNGIGIPREFHPRLFGMFERAYEHSAFPGTGVGLAIVRKAMEKMGGKVEIESDGSNGTLAWIELQAANQ